MKLVFFLAPLFVSFLASTAAFAGEIRGRVLNAQGGPVRGATVTVSAHNEPASVKVVTAEDGSYVIPNLEPGVYTVTVSIANGQQVLRQQVTVGSQAEPNRADFRFTAVATEGVAGPPGRLTSPRKPGLGSQIKAHLHAPHSHKHRTGDTGDKAVAA